MDDITDEFGLVSSYPVYLESKDNWKIPDLVRYWTILFYLIFREKAKGSARLYELGILEEGQELILFAELAPPKRGEAEFGAKLETKTGFLKESQEQSEEEVRLCV